MLRTAQSLPLTGPSTLGFAPTRFQTEPPACYRASWQLPRPDFHRQATTSLRLKVNYTSSPPSLLGAQKTEAKEHDRTTSHFDCRRDSSTSPGGPTVGLKALLTDAGTPLPTGGRRVCAGPVSG
jgi:hypothetical protein